MRVRDRATSDLPNLSIVQSRLNDSFTFFSACGMRTQAKRVGTAPVRTSDVAERVTLVPLTDRTAL